MSTISLKVKIALISTWIESCQYDNFRNNSNPKLRKFVLRCRALAVVNHDRLLNGRK